MYWNLKPYTPPPHPPHWHPECSHSGPATVAAILFRGAFSESPLRNMFFHIRKRCFIHMVSIEKVSFNLPFSHQLFQAFFFSPINNIIKRTQCVTESCVVLHCQKQALRPLESQSHGLYHSLESILPSKAEIRFALSSSIATHWYAVTLCLHVLWPQTTRTES